MYKSNQQITTRMASSYLIMFALTLTVLLGTAAHIWKQRKQVDDMHGMMVGMTLGMLAGLFTATLYLIPTGDFLTGVIVGSIAGLVFGVPFGRLGGHLGIVEGVVAGPMGGMMGAMLGQMVRPFNIEVFVPFFMAVVLVTLLGISYAVHCGVSCCASKKRKPGPVSQRFISTWTVATIIVLGISIFLPFSLPGPSPTARATPTDQALKLPSSLQAFAQEISAEAVQKDGYQEAEITITQSRYIPNVITAKKGIPLRIILTADKTAGCARDISFPDFKIQSVVPVDKPVALELTPQDEGEFPFRCSMDMARGKLIVTD